jgi:hypothetical protein
MLRFANAITGMTSAKKRAATKAVGFLSNLLILETPSMSTLQERSKKKVEPILG